MMDQYELFTENSAEQGLVRPSVIRPTCVSYWRRRLSRKLEKLAKVLDPA